MRSLTVAGEASPARIARFTGLLYLVIIIGAGFAQGAARGALVVPGDPAATAEAIRGASDLFRYGLVGDLIAFLADTGVAVLLYVLLRPVSRVIALLAAAFRLLAHPAIAAVNLLAHWLGGTFAEPPPWLSGFTPQQLDGLALLALEVHNVGYLIAGAFFGVSLVLLAWLMVRSPLFPGWLGVLVGIAGASYLLETFTFLAVPSLAEFGASAVVVAASVGEVTLCLWLLVKGVRTTSDDAPPGSGPLASGDDARAPA